MRKKSNDLTVFMVILSNIIMQNYPKNYPSKEVRIIYPDYVVTGNGYFPSMAQDTATVTNEL